MNKIEIKTLEEEDFDQMNDWEIEVEEEDIIQEDVKEIEYEKPKKEKAKGRPNSELLENGKPKARPKPKFADTSEDVSSLLTSVEFD